MATTVEFINSNSNGNGKRRSTYINWGKDVFPSVYERLTAFENERVKPTVRGLLYVLESMNVLKKNDYNGLSKHLVEWRENGRLPIDCVADNTRHIMDIHQYLRKSNYSMEQVEQLLIPSVLYYYNSRIIVDFDEELQSWNDIVTPKQHIQSGINYLNDTIKDLYDYIPRWLNQPKYVEVFVEKDAMAGSIKAIMDSGDANSKYKTSPRHVIVAPNKGWSSYTFVAKNLDRLLAQQKNGKEVFVQYYGDSDPSGERMTAEDSKLVRLLNTHDIHFERIAITEDTIRTFSGLEDIKDRELDDETLDKLERNPNYDWFIERHDGEVWQIELDALLLDLPSFKELVLSNVDKHFDTSIQKEAIEQFKQLYPVKSIRHELTKALEDLSKLINSSSWKWRA
jgi:hypothetical protein